MDYFEGKRVFLTGASSGIGEGLAEALAQRGAVVALVARREDQLETLRGRIEDAGGTARAFQADVVNAGELRAAEKHFTNEFGHIDILIANAGIGGNDEKTRSLEPDAVKKVIDVNLLGAVNSVFAVLPGMRKRNEGQLVAISSLAGLRGLPKSAAYSASKAGMNAFFESVRLDLGSTAIAVTIITPGFIKTPLTSGRKSKMPFIMDLEDSIPLFLKAIERRKKFAAFPWQLATVVKLARFFPAGLYDLIAGKARYRE
ncbi:MAG: SDR family NAD(P)-dependent oxidoreductase [Acidobacteriota bacterium]|nr:SDR family NAD(P)-dependent oxidoreductase [Acidobacteriota bacterium]